MTYSARSFSRLSMGESFKAEHTHRVPQQWSIPVVGDPDEPAGCLHAGPGGRERQRPDHAIGRVHRSRDAGVVAAARAQEQQGLTVRGNKPRRYHGATPFLEPV